MSEEHIPLGLNPENFKVLQVMIAEDSTTDRTLLRRYLQSEKFEILMSPPMVKIYYSI